MNKLWQEGSESELNRQVAATVESFTVGNDYELDVHLLPYDIEASGVHVKALGRAGILNAEEESKLLEGLNRILELWKQEGFAILPEHEDGHTAIELWLTEEYGDLGKKIHTGRSRNDQVLTAVRLYEKDRLETIRNESVKLIRSMLDLAESHQKLPMPGYTHTRKAMLSTVGQWLGGFIELLLMQLKAGNGVEGLIDRSPLGTAAGFGTTIDLDREQEAEEMGFAQPMACATTAQLSRGWVELQLVGWLSGMTSLLGRFSTDVIQFSSQAYGFIDIDPVLTTGSSIMPQKKNPDVAELIRGNHSRVAGACTSLQAVIANLGAGYHRDLQLTKEPVMTAVETTLKVLEASRLLVEGLSFQEQTLREACSSDLLAAEEAYKLVREEGVSFREAYQQVKRSGSEKSSIEIDELFESYKQLGSPGNPGLDQLRKELKAFGS